MDNLTMSRFSVHRPRRLTAFLTAALVAVGAAACDPLPPPDGRDLGVVIDSGLAATVEEGSTVTVTGTVTNHGTVAASAVVLDLAFDKGIAADSAVIGGGSCTAVSGLHQSCAVSEPLLPGASLPFSLEAAVGTTSGASVLIASVGSDGSEPATDPHTNLVAETTQVRPPAAAARPLGVRNGTNYLGTGNLLASAGLPTHPDEGVYLSVNTFCASKVNGDRFQTGYSSGVCTGPANPEYRADGYGFLIDVPAGRTSDLDVVVWDARFNQQPLPGGEITADLNYTGSTSEPFTFTLFKADRTPLDYNDNPLACTRTFGSETVFDYTFLGSQRWNWLCSIPVSDPAGAYLLKVTNGGVLTTPAVNGRNAFAVAALYQADGSDPSVALCRRESRPTCPVVSSAGDAPLFLNRSSAITRVPAGSIPATEEGRSLHLELFDPGEGVQLIRILAPSGAGTWVPVSFTWDSAGVGSSSSPVQSVDSSNSRFNGRLLHIDVDLAGYNPPPTNTTWMVEYTSFQGTTTDQTTWTGRVVDFSH